jgi:DNA-binding XRE family transcriptional regulator
MASVLLLTNRAGFESQWSAACHQLGLTVRTHALSDFARAVDRAPAVVIDAGGDRLTESELLACVGFARAHGAATAIALPEGARFSEAQEDLLLELCTGLVARGEHDLPRVLGALARRSTPDREAHFVYLAAAHPRSRAEEPRTSTQGSDELLAILGDASVCLLDRPFSADDQGELPVETIALSADRRSARIELRDGSTLELIAAELAQGRLASARALNGAASAALGDVDGVRLGQRLRALRLAAGLTQAELARRTGIHRPNIARVEAGRHTPSLETLARLAAAIGVSTTRVLSD